MSTRLGLFAVLTMCLSSSLMAQAPTGTVTGTVVSSGNEPVSGVLVFVDEGPGSVVTNWAGGFQLEGVPGGRHLLNFRKAGFEPHQIDLVFGPSEDRRDLGAVELDEGSDPTATFTGRITDGVSGQPLGNAVVKINGAVITLTDGEGVFRVREAPIAWGNNEFEVGRFAFTAQTREFWVGNPDETLDFSAALDPVPIDVGGIVATVSGRARVSTRLQPFYERLEESGGQFVTRNRLEERAPPVLTEALRGVSGVRLRPTPMGVEVLFTRATAVSFTPGAEAECLSPLIFLDGRFFGGGRTYVDLDAVANPEEVEGIEIYNGVATVPTEFRRPGSQCGVIGVWTR